MANFPFFSKRRFSVFDVLPHGILYRKQGKLSMTTHKKEFLQLSRMVSEKRFILVPSSKKEESSMNCKANKCIECTVSQCAYHCDEANFCSLDRIMVGTHEANPTMDQCTDCKSFKKK